MPPTCASHQDKLGTFRRLRGQETNGYAVYQRRADDVMLWQASGGWWIGPAGSVGKNTGYWRCIDSAR
eukprot:4135305-Prymnesium_polylepis.2